MQAEVNLKAGMMTASFLWKIESGAMIRFAPRLFAPASLPAHSVKKSSSTFLTS
jgi:hypothetical protein